MKPLPKAKPERFPVKASDVERLLLRLGFEPYGQNSKLFYHAEDDLTTSLPDDPDEVLHERWLEFILRDIRLTERKFRELLKAS